jgi:signal-transduction protein with cAMP-binding, CBS, and nucleotidyltransferase domain
VLPDWRDEDSNLLFGFMEIRNVRSGNALIRRGEPDRTVYFVLRGELEIIVQSSDGLTMGRVGPGWGWRSPGRTRVFRWRAPIGHGLGGGPV